MNLDIKNMLNITKSMSLSGIYTISKSLVGIIFNKIIIVFYGVSALAVVGNLKNILQIIENISSVSIFESLTVKISSKKSTFYKVVINSILLVLVFSTISSVFVVIYFTFFQDDLSVLYDNYLFFLLLIIYSLFIGFIQISLAISNSKKSVQGYFSLHFIALTIQSALFILLWLKYNFYGIFASFILGPIIIAFFHIFLIKRSLKNAPKISKTISSKNMLSTLKLASVSIVTTVVFNVKQIAIRNHIIENESIELAGIWEGLNILSIQLFFISSMFISNFLLPKFSKQEFSIKLISKSALVLFLVISTYYFLLITFDDSILLLLFDQNYKVISQYFISQFAIDLSTITSIIFLKYLFALKKIKFLIILEILSITILGIGLIYFSGENIIHNVQKSQLLASIIIFTITIISFFGNQFYKLNK
jgi:O-antigen/teichoic acid export membrane protein